MRWLGFDGNHYRDLAPAMCSLVLPPALRRSRWRGEVYRDAEFMKKQCIRLAEQAKRAGQVLKQR